MAGAHYELTVGGQTFEGETGGDGVITRKVPGSPTSGKLVLDMWSFDFTIESIGGADSDAGACVRLDNLGYYADEEKAALMRFQSAYDLDPDGEMSGGTKGKLTDIYGC